MSPSRPSPLNTRGGINPSSRPTWKSFPANVLTLPIESKYSVNMGRDFRTLQHSAVVAMGEQENRRCRQEEQPGSDHRRRHQLGPGASFHFHAGAQPDPITVDQLYRIESYGYVASDSQKPFALNSSDRTAGHGSGRNHGEAVDAHISQHHKIQEVSYARVRRGNTFGKLKLNGSSIWNGQSGRNRTHLLG